MQFKSNWIFVIIIEITILTFEEYWSYKSLYLIDVYSNWYIKLWVCYVTYVLVVHCQGPPIMQKNILLHKNHACGQVYFFKNPSKCIWISLDLNQIMAGVNSKQNISSLMFKIPDRRHYNLQLVYLFAPFWKPFTYLFSRRFFRELYTYVWLVFKNGSWSKVTCIR